jgi:segregation and condensation protein B
MRQKRKARGQAARDAADALARQAGDSLEIVEDQPGDEVAAEESGDAEAEPGVEAAEASSDDASEDILRADTVADEDFDDDLDDGKTIEEDEEEVDAAAMRAVGGRAEGEEPDEEAEAEDEATGAFAPALDPAKEKALVEALIFAADKPVTLQRLRQLTRIADVTRLQSILEELEADHANTGIVLQQVSGGYLFRTHSQYSQWVQQLIQGRPVRLSRAQLETLAICAYRQPITRPEIDQIRGVDSGGTLKVLLDRGLVRILGKKEEVGRPLLYGTTTEFLDFFSLKDLRELPTLREYSELSEESRQMVERVTGEPLPSTPVHAPAMDPDAAAAQAKIDASVAAVDALQHEVVTDLPVEQEPEGHDLRDLPVEPVDDAAP